MSRDPLGEAGGLNLYAFVGNDPVNWVDPFGLKYIDINFSAGAFFGGNVGFVFSEDGLYIYAGGGLVVGGGVAGTYSSADFSEGWFVSAQAAFGFAGAIGGPIVDGGCPDSTGDEYDIAFEGGAGTPGASAVVNHAWKLMDWDIDIDKMIDDFNQRNIKAIDKWIERKKKNRPHNW